MGSEPLSQIQGLWRPRPMYNMVCLYEHDGLAYSRHFSSGNQRWAQHVLAYHGINHHQTICECLWPTRPLTAADKVSRGSDSTLNWRSIIIVRVYHNKPLGTILCPGLGAEWIGRISRLPRAPLGPSFMTGLYSVQSIVPTIVLVDLS